MSIHQDTAVFFSWKCLGLLWQFHLIKNGECFTKYFSILTFGNSRKIATNKIPMMKHHVINYASKSIFNPPNVVISSYLEILHGNFIHSKMQNISQEIPIFVFQCLCYNIKTCSMFVCLFCFVTCVGIS